MSSASSIALSGMNAANLSLQATAHNIANLNTNGFRRQTVDASTAVNGGVDTTLQQVAEPGAAPETDMVGLLQAKNAFLANLAVFKTANSMSGALLDITE
jgi:flagellar basal body rod protein FlgG